MREHTELMRPDLGVGARLGSMLDPAIEKYLLEFHAAMDLESFWKATQQLLSVAIPNQLLGLTLRHDPILPRIEKWTGPMPAGFFGGRPLKQFLAAHPRTKLVRIADLFSSRRAFLRSTFRRRYLGPNKCSRATCLFFWQRRQLACAIVILRSDTQGELSAAEIKLLRQLYPQFAIALRRLRALDHERAVRTDLEEFVKRLPLPTILLRWNLKLLFQNRAAREFCLLWENGPENARLMKTAPTIPLEIVDGCRRLKQRWRRAKRNGLLDSDSVVEGLQHPNSADLRATIRLKQLNDAVIRPHFVIECENAPRPQDRQRSFQPRLSQLIRLTGREQEITRLVCHGRSNQEIADAACLSLPTVKKHLHAVFRKLEVASRSQLMALML